MSRNKRMLATAAVLAVLLAIVLLMIMRPVEEMTFLSTPSDGYIAGVGQTIHPYHSVWGDPSLTYNLGSVYDKDTNILLGHKKVVAPYGSYYGIYRAFFFWDTSDIPDDARIRWAKISLYIWNVQVEEGGDHFAVVVQRGIPYGYYGEVHPRDPLSPVDYTAHLYAGDGGRSPHTSALQNRTWFDIYLNDDGRSWIDKGGTTKLCLRSSKEISAIPPDGRAFLTLLSRETDWDPDGARVPYLTVGFQHPIPSWVLPLLIILTLTAIVAVWHESLPLSPEVITRRGI